MNDLHGELTRFIVVGVGSNLINFFVYLLAHASGAPLAAASAVGYLAGFLNSYYFGKSWVFDAGDRIGRLTILHFTVVYTIGGIGMGAIIETLDRTQGWDYRVSWLFGTAFAFANNFMGSKWLVFNGRKTHHGN